MVSFTQMLLLAVLVLGDFVLSAVAVWFSPDLVPVHWNFRGTVDRYGSPWELAVLQSSIVLVSAALLVLLPRMGNLGAPLRQSGKTYGRIALAIVAALIGIHAIMVFSGWNHPLDAPSAIMADLGVLFIVLGNWMGKIRRNSLVGIRTPWTLKSDFIWERTHRIGGRLQFILGVAVLVAALLLPVWVPIIVILGGCIGLAVWAWIYSSSLARDPHVQQPDSAGT